VCSQPDVAILQDSEITTRSSTCRSLLSLQTLTMSLSLPAFASSRDLLAQCSNLRRLHWTDYLGIQQHSTGLLDASVMLASSLLLPLLTLLTFSKQTSIKLDFTVENYVKPSRFNAWNVSYISKAHESYLPASNSASSVRGSVPSRLIIR
jgi:hypothetical protein